MIKASIIMPVYNGEKYLRCAIESILNQSYVDFEFIIVNDGSTDSTRLIISEYSDSRIKILDLSHVGLVNALNMGIKQSNGKYIIRFDADDVSLENRLERLIDVMDNDKDLAICGSWAEIIDEKGGGVGFMEYPPKNDNDIRKYVLLHSPFIHPSVIIRKDVLLRVGCYRNFKHIEDYELWTRLLHDGKARNISEYLIKYRIHHNQVTGKNRLFIRIRGIFVRMLAIKRVLLNL